MTDEEPTNGPGPRGPMDGSVEPSSLGASPSLPASGAKERRRGRVRSATGRLKGKGGGPGKGTAVILVVVLLLALVPLIGSSLKRTPRDKVGISYGGGPIEGAHFQRIVQPGSTLFFNGLFDPLYLYPADQQNYIVSQAKGEGDTPTSDAIVAPSKDRVQVSYQVAVYYKLNTDLLVDFHEEFGLKYAAYTAAGWQSLIQDTFRQQIENALQEETRRYDVGAIFGDADLLLTIQQQVQQTLSERLQLAMGQKYFCAPTFDPGGECGDPTFVIKTIGIPDSVLAAFEKNRTSGIDVLTAENKVDQQEVEAQGIEALRAAAGDFGSVYALLEAVRSGQVSFWVLPDGGLTLTTPDGAGGPAPSDPGAGGATPTPGGGPAAGGGGGAAAGNGAGAGGATSGGGATSDGGTTPGGGGG